MKNKIIVISFITYIITFSLLHIIIPNEEISKEERRKLTTFPTFELTNNYIKSLEEYFLDHFPMRNDFRSIKANFNYNILQKLDNNNIYIKDGYIYKSDYPTNKKSINNFITNIEKTKQVLNENNKTYLLIIPDKNYYLKSNDFLHIDYDYIYKEIKKLNSNNIDIRNILTINDYYQTDTHWKQENLKKVVQEMSNKMNFKYQEYEYTKNTYNNFYGVYYAESALKKEPETLTYLTNEIIEKAEVTYLENNNLNKVYNKTKLESFDSYEVYLDGASAFIQIINNLSPTDKELIIFRDSFASSITPLLIPYYKKITLIDNRYINSENYLKQITFTNQDVLFLYSTLIINNSFSLKN